MKKQFINFIKITTVFAQIKYTSIQFVMLFVKTMKIADKGFVHKKLRCILFQLKSHVDFLVSKKDTLGP